MKHAENKQRFDEEIRQRKVREGIEAEDRQKKNSAKGLLIAVLAFIALGTVVFFGIRGENI